MYIHIRPLLKRSDSLHIPWMDYVIDTVLTTAGTCRIHKHIGCVLNTLSQRGQPCVTRDNQNYVSSWVLGSTITGRVGMKQLCPGTKLGCTNESLQPKQIQAHEKF